MGIINDIYSTVDEKIVRNGFYDVNIEGKKELVEKELRNYFILKIKEINNNVNFSDDVFKDFNIYELFEFLANQIPSDEHSKTLNHIIHYVLKIASNLQGYTIVWYAADHEQYIDDYNTIINEHNLWSRLTTHTNTDYVKTFNLVYDVFQNHFMVEDEKVLKFKQRI